jgi:hypothetical protein
MGKSIEERFSETLLRIEEPAPALFRVCSVEADDDAGSRRVSR